MNEYVVVIVVVVIVVVVVIDLEERPLLHKIHGLCHLSPFI